jgi:hypothetical protein
MQSTLLKRTAAAAAAAVVAGPEPGLTRDPTSGWLQHGGLTLQLVDTAGWKRPHAAAPTQAPTATPHNTKTAAAGSRDSDAMSSSSAARGGVKGGAATTKVLADASLAQAKRALSAVHVAVLLLDAPRLLTIGQVRVAAGSCCGVSCPVFAANSWVICLAESVFNTATLHGTALQPAQSPPAAVYAQATMYRSAAGKPRAPHPGHSHIVQPLQDRCSAVTVLGIHMLCLIRRSRILSCRPHCCSIPFVRPSRVWSCSWQA